MIGAHPNDPSAIVVISSNCALFMLMLPVLNWIVLNYSIPSQVPELLLLLSRVSLIQQVVQYFEYLFAVHRNCDVPAR